MKMDTITYACIFLIVMIIIGVSSYFIGKDYKTVRLANYVVMCEAAGYTEAQCLFARKHRREATALRGN